MKKTLFTILILFALFSSIGFAVTIYPLVNRLNVEANQRTIELTINVANNSPSIADVDVEISDFVIEGSKYLYEIPNYAFSIKDWITIESTHLILQPGQSIDYPIKINIPSGFKGAQAFGAIHFKQKGKQSEVFETIFDYISLIILDFPTVKNIKAQIQDVSIYDLTTTASKTLIDKYGNFGTVIDIDVKNNGNAVLALNGEMRLISREINRIITSIPLNSNNFVVFPDRANNFEFFIPYVLPKGDFEIQMDGISQNVRVTAFKKLKIEGKSSDRVAVMIDPEIILINVKRTIENSKITIQNLSPLSTQFGLSTISKAINILPGKIRLSPYSKINGFVKFDSRLEKLKDGDNVFKINIDSENEISLFKNPKIVLRYGNLEPNIESFITDIATNTFALNVKNTGNTILIFKVIRTEKLQSNDLTNEIILFPGENKKVFLEIPYNEIIKNSTFIMYKIYGETDFKYQKNIGDVKKWKNI